MNKKSLLVASAITAAVVACPAFADRTYFDDRTEFEDAAKAAGVASLSLESFEGSYTPAASIDFGDFTVSEAWDALNQNIIRQTEYLNGDEELFYTSRGSLATFSFPDPISAFGLEITATPGSGVYLDTGDFSEFDYRDLVGGEPVFWGVVDTDQFTSINFEALADGGDIFFDEVSYEGEAAQEIIVSIDIKFCSDPNAFNCKKNGVLPVTIFGTGDFDVADVDMSTLQLCLAPADPADEPVCTSAPRNWSIADRGDPTTDLGAGMCALDPVTGEELDYLNKDTILDLDAAFEASEVQEMLATGFCDEAKNTVSGELIITGSMGDGTPIRSIPVGNTGIDQLVKKGK